jgi:hypothetical protein
VSPATTVAERIDISGSSTSAAGPRRQRESFAMFSSYVVEVGEHDAGIVILEQGGFRFFAALEAVRALEGRIYPTVAAASAAARLVIAGNGATANARRTRGRSSNGGDRCFAEHWLLHEGCMTARAGRKPTPRREMRCP